MKKFFVLILILLVGCALLDSSDEEVKNEETEIVEEIEEDEEYVVTITVPEYFFEGVSQEDLDQETEEYGYISQTLNEDGSVTMEMSEEVYDDLLEGIIESNDEQIEDLVNDEETHMYDINYLDDYTYFKVYLDDYDSIDTAMLYGDLLFMLGTIYDAYTVNDIDTYSIEYYDLDDNLITSDTFTGTFDDFYDTHGYLFGEEVEFVTTSSLQKQFSL